jgi:hypothetical protein
MGSIAALGVLALSFAATDAPTYADEASAPATGQLSVIQAIPAGSVDVLVDGEPTEQSVEVGSVLGPYDLSAGSHTISFTGSGGLDLTSKVEVKAGASSDIVLHLPAEIDGDAVVNTYDTPLGPIGADKSRVLIAHTATVAPADVRVDGATVFTNIANGEFAEADVPAGAHKVELLPTGLTTDPILGPLDVTLAPQTVTMVYAVGSPTDKSMNVIVHTETLDDDGNVVPDTIDTGSAGLVAAVEVTPFDATAGTSSAFPVVPLAGFALVAAAACLVLIRACRVGRARRP